MKWIHVYLMYLQNEGTEPKKKKKEGVLNNHNFQVSFLKSFALSFFLQVLKGFFSLLS